MLIDSIHPALHAFKIGFNRFFEVSTLRFFHPEEIEDFICGNSDESEWKIENLLRMTEPKNGYSKDSRSYLDILRFMSELDARGRKEFLKFTTGSSRLPCGGFKAL